MPAEGKKLLVQRAAKAGRAGPLPPPQRKPENRKTVDPSLPTPEPQGRRALLTVFLVMAGVFCVQHVMSPWERDRLHRLGKPQVEALLHQRLGVPVTLGSFKSDLLMLNTSRFRVHGEALSTAGNHSFVATFRINRRGKPILAVLEQQALQSPSKSQSSEASKESKQRSGAASSSASR